MKVSLRDHVFKKTLQTTMFVYITTNRDNNLTNKKHDVGKASRATLNITIKQKYVRNIFSMTFL